MLLCLALCGQHRNVRSSVFYAPAVLPPTPTGGHYLGHALLIPNYVM